MAASRLSMPYQFPPLVMLPPAADAAGRTSTNYVSLRNALKAWLICTVNQGNAAPVLFTPLQATSLAGAGSKAIGGADTTAQIWLANNALSTAAGDLFLAQTAALNFTTDATTNTKVVIFEIIPEGHLDLVNGFNHIGVSTGASNAANITSVQVCLWGSYEAGSGSLPSALV